MDTLPDPFEGSLLVTSLQLQLAPKQPPNRSRHRTCRRNSCEIEARSVEQRFAIEAACTDAEASDCAASTVLTNSVHLWALELLTAFTQSVKAGTGSARSQLGTSAGV